MANSNLIQRFSLSSPWVFVVGMSALSVYLIGLIFFLLKNYPGALYETLNLYLQDPNVDRLVMKVQALENEIQDLEDEVARLTAEVHKANDYLKDARFRQEQAALGLLLGMTITFIVRYVSLHLAGG
jgi:ABC-type phosphate transport system auxiliary subunit